MSIQSEVWLAGIDMLGVVVMYTYASRKINIMLLFNMMEYMLETGVNITIWYTRKDICLHKLYLRVFADCLLMYMVNILLCIICISWFHLWSSIICVQIHVTLPPVVQMLNVSVETLLMGPLTVYATLDLLEIPSSPALVSHILIVLTRLVRNCRQWNSFYFSLHYQSWIAWFTRARATEKQATEATAP